MGRIVAIIFFKEKYNGVMTSGDVTISISKFIDDHIRFFFRTKKV